jgi:hypothetical protein
MQHRRIGQHNRLTEGMREILGERQGLLAASAGLVWIPQMPQGMGGPDATKHSQIRPDTGDIRAVLGGIIENSALLEVFACQGKFASPKRGPGQLHVCGDAEHRVGLPLGQSEQLLAQRTGLLEIRPHHTHGNQPPQR